MGGKVAKPHDGDAEASGLPSAIEQENSPAGETDEQGYVKGRITAAAGDGPESSGSILCFVVTASTAEMSPHILIAAMMPR